MSVQEPVPKGAAIGKKQKSNKFVMSFNIAGGRYTPWVTASALRNGALSPPAWQTERVPKGTQGLSWDPFGTYCLPPACQLPPRTCPEASPWSCVQGHQRHNPRQRCLNTTQGPVKVVGEEESNSRVIGKPPSLRADGSYPALILPQPLRGRPCPRGLAR